LILVLDIKKNGNYGKGGLNLQLFFLIFKPLV